MSDPRALDHLKADYDAARLANLIAGHEGPGGLPKVALKRRGRDWLGLCPFHGEKTPSFTVYQGGGAGRFHCFGCGRHGSVIDYVQEALGCSTRDAIHALGGGDVRIDPKLAAEREAERRRQLAKAERDLAARIDIARAIWRAAEPDDGTIARYLAARGLEPVLEGGGVPATLRLISPRVMAACIPWARNQDHHTIGKFPAMVAPFLNSDRRVTGVHCTYLEPDGSGKAPVSKAKQIFGQFGACAIPLSAPALDLVIGEGIETTLTALIARPGAQAWCAGSLNNLAGLGRRERTPRPHPTREGAFLPSPWPDHGQPAITLPDGVRRVWIIADADGDVPSVEALVTRARRRWEGRGRAVRIVWPPAGQDLNDIAKGVA
jgi:DNA primase